jgi:hypothetical protein
MIYRYKNDCVVQKNGMVFLKAVDHLTISYVFPKCTNKNLGEKIMQKTISVSVFSKISANFKGEIHNVKISKGVKIGRGGGGALSR